MSGVLSLRPGPGEAASPGVDAALRELAAGRAVVMVDDTTVGGEGMLTFAAEKATDALVAFMVRHTSGCLRVAMTEADCARLDLPPMSHTNQHPRGDAYTVTVDARAGVTTGISARDRARTVRLLADPTTLPGDLNRPGHVMPLMTHRGGVLARPGPAEAAVDLARLAGLRPAGVLCEIVSLTRPHLMATGPELETFCQTHGLLLVPLSALVAHRRRTEKQVERAADTTIPTVHGQFRAVGYRTVVEGREHVAFVKGDVRGCEDVLVAVHTECLAGDVFGSLRCECALRLDTALRSVTREGRGVVLYLRTGELAAPWAEATPPVTADWQGADGQACLQILDDLGVRSVRVLEYESLAIAD